MQAIVTTYKGPTETKGARIIAKCEAKKITVPLTYDYSTEGEHRHAALELCKRLGWTGELVSGALPTGGYCHVFTGR